jgi:PAS domain S-box-containing protein
MPDFTDLSRDCETTIRSILDQIKKVNEIESVVLCSVKGGDKISARMCMGPEAGKVLPSQMEQALCNIKQDFPYIYDKLEKNIPVTETNELFKRISPGYSDVQTKSVIFLPVAVEGVIWGFVFCMHSIDYDWKARDLSLFIELTHKIGFSIERKRMLDALLEIESRQRYLLDNIQDILVCYDTNARISYVSDNIRQISGYEPNEIIGRLAEEFVHPDARVSFNEAAQRLRMTNGGGIYEFPLINRNGTKHWYRMNTKPNFDESGNFMEVVAVMSNIDKYKEVEKDYELKEKNENLYQHIVGKVQDLVWASTLDYMTMYIAPSVKDILGYTVEEALGMEFGTTYKPESLCRLTEMLREARAAIAAGTYDFSGELTVNQIRRNRRTIKGRLRISILCDSKNEPYGYLGITSFRKRSPSLKQRSVPDGVVRKRGRPRGSRKFT